MQPYYTYRIIDRNANNVDIILFREYPLKEYTLTLSLLHDDIIKIYKHLQRSCRNSK